MTLMIEPNSQVRLKYDTSRIGTFTGESKSAPGRSTMQLKIRFNSRVEWIPESEVEPVPDVPEAAIDMLRAGRIARASDLRRVLTHIRLNGKLADVIYSMELTSTDFYAYQFKPVLRFLNSPANGLLIADEVGLGKTIEAGLIWTELRSRFESRRLLVVCPAMLREKWQRELRLRFGVRADIVNADGLLKHLRQAESDEHGFALIASLQGLRPRANWEDWDKKPIPPTVRLAQHLSERQSDEPVFDLVIIDEAHDMRNPASQNNAIGRLLKHNTQHLVLLSATPLHNRNTDLFSLVHLLDEDTFRYSGDLDPVLDATRPLVRARDHVLSANPDSRVLLRDLEEARSQYVLRENRQLASIIEDVSDPEFQYCRASRSEIARRIELTNPLANVITRTRKREVKEWRVIREPHAEFSSMTGLERDVYDRVTDAVSQYADANELCSGFLLCSPQRQLTSCIPATIRSWKARAQEIAESDHDQHKESDVAPIVTAICEELSDFDELETLIQEDSKYERLLHLLRSYLKENPDEKVVLFSSFVGTVRYLNERLRYDGIRAIEMHGQSKESKDDLLTAFRTDPSIRILLSTEVGAEGIDLQFCRLLFNYDLPWNPMRVEQRIGRLDRLGQKAQKISICNLLYAGTIDARIYERLYEKLDLCRQALGDFEASLGEEIEKLEVDLLKNRLSVEQQNERIDQSAQALANRRRQEEELEQQASHLMAYGDYILSQINAAHDLNRRITSEDLQTYVLEFLQTYYPGCEFRLLNESEISYDISLSNQAKSELEQFIRHRRLEQTPFTRPTSRPHRCRFRNRVGEGSATDGIAINQFHSLVRFAAAEIERRSNPLTPAVAVRIEQDDARDHDICPGRYGFAVQKWTFSGFQKSEYLVYGVVSLESKELLPDEHAERLVMLAANTGEEWHGVCADLDTNVAADLIDQVAIHGLYDRFILRREEIRRQNDDRIDLQLQSLERHLDSQGSKLRETLEKHRRMGRARLVPPTLGRIEKLEQRVEMNRIELERRRHSSAASATEVVGVIDIPEIKMFNGSGA